MYARNEDSFKGDWLFHNINCVPLCKGSDTDRPKVVNRGDGWSRVHGRMLNHQIRKLETWLLQLSTKRIQFPPLRVKNLSQSYPSKKEEKERSKKERKGSKQESKQARTQERKRN